MPRDRNEYYGQIAKGEKGAQKAAENGDMSKIYKMTKDSSEQQRNFFFIISR